MIDETQNLINENFDSIDTHTFRKFVESSYCVWRDVSECVDKAVCNSNQNFRDLCQHLANEWVRLSMRQDTENNCKMSLAFEKVIRSYLLAKKGV